MRPIKSFLMVLALLMATPATAQVTNAFTYQGELEQADDPATGEFDFEFVLFDSDSGGLAIAGPVNVENVFVDGGLFATELDFGPNVFGMIDLWLEVSVREGDSTGDFTTLTPRQKLTPAPLAQHALNVETDAIGSAQIMSDSVTSTEIDETTVQRRVSGSCNAGDFVTGIQADGTPVCEGEIGDLEGVDAGSGLTGGGGSGTPTLAIDSSAVQERVTGTCAPGMKLSGINVDGNLDCQVLPVGVAWIADGRGGDDVGKHTSIAMRNSGRPIISYFDDTNDALKVYDCADAACSTGTARTVEGAGSDFVGEYTSIAIRASGKPIISYFANSSGFAIAGLGVYDCDDTACSSGTARTVDGVSAATALGLHTSIAVRDTGNPIISYWDAINAALKVYDCADPACASGTAQTLDGSGGDEVGRFTSIAVRGTGNPIISYRDDTNLALKVYDCGDANCGSSAGTARTLDGSGGDDVGNYTSIAIRASGNPIISYQEGSNEFLMDNALKVFTCNNADCSSGNASFLDLGGEFTNIALRDGDHPIISYRGTGGLQVYDCANGDCSSGFTHSLDGSGDSEFTSIVVRDNGKPIVSYRDSINTVLKAFSCGDPDCAR